VPARDINQLKVVAARAVDHGMINRNVGIGRRSRNRGQSEPLSRIFKKSNLQAADRERRSTPRLCLASAERHTSAD
jgi:hypothetical protein